MNRLLALLSWITLCLSVSVHAADKTCRDEWRIDWSLELISDWGGRIPNVPPREAAFISKEKDSIFNGNLSAAEAESRLSLLMRHPYYYTYEVHQAFAKVTESVQKAMAEPKPQNRMAGAASAIIDAVDAQSAMTNYANAHPGPDTPPPFRSMAMRAFAYRLSMYVKCEAKTIP